MRNDEPRWTIRELSEAAAAALRASADYSGPPNDRVREAPDLRLVRYYTTLGLLDRALEFRGRTALYGRRHLLQLVAVKRLQAQGLSLADVQRRLCGLPDDDLEAIARIPPDRVADSSPVPEPTNEPRARLDDFWRAEPAPFRPSGEDEGENKDEDEAPPIQGRLALDLGEGAILLLPERFRDSGFLAGLDRDEARRAAAPLLTWLRRQGGGERH